MPQNYFEEYLNVAPFSHALWRSLEAQELARVKRQYKYHRPILDLGCGFGEFAGVFFDSSIEVGVDISPTDLIHAAKVKKYHNLYVEDARKLSLPSQSFSTVISISVLEHIPQVHRAIKEVSRVLKKGGYFIVTMPLNKFYSHLLYPSLLEKIGARNLAHQYYRAVNKAFKHVNLWPEKKWVMLFKKTGFEIVESKLFISKPATRVFDLFLLTALPSQLSRWLFGTRSIWGLRWKRQLLKPLYQRLSQDKSQTGCNLIIVAKKK
ncbi:MAG: class I SAM-dependent methyltransferase [Candidatus Chisholmbacteria bacterium]|nr:class I SAM-dependent methyltransferase [Candidatus Chisholmbacteria bacterium]